MSSLLPNEVRMVKHLANEMIHWQPGKIHISKYELVHDELIGAFNKTRLLDLIKIIEFQVDRMTRNSSK